MRHLIGIVLAVVLAAAVFCAATWGYVRLAAQSSRVAGGASLLSDHHALLAFGALAGTGLLAGILIAVPRISPLASGLPGLLLLGWTALYLVSVRQAVDLIPLRSDAFGAGFEAMLFNGILASAGLVMIVPLFVPSRWRVRDEAEDSAAAASDYVSSLAEPANSPALAALPERIPTPTAPVGAPSTPPWPMASPAPSRESEPAW